MNFDFSSVANIKESGKRLEAGIKKATFKGISFATTTSQKTGDTYKTMVLTLDIEDYGPYTQSFFEPQDNERKENQWGGKQPSPVDHFLVTIREVFDALDPAIGKALDSGSLQLKGTFKAIVDKVKEMTDPHVGDEVEVKLIPGRNGYVNIPSYPARVNKDGGIGIATRIIGHNLSFTPSELKAIEKAKNATPTEMPKKADADPLALDDDTKSVVNAMAADVNATDGLDDLPF